MSIGERYPHPDIAVNPHTDIFFGHDSRVPTIDDIVAKNIAVRMTINPLCDTQTKLAKRAGISQSHVSRLLNQGSSATIGTLAKVARALGCGAYELMLDDEQARRALIERLMSGPSVETERVEQAGFVPVSTRANSPKKQ